MPMWRGLIFLIQFAIITALAALLIQNPGSISIEWFEYTVTLHSGIFIGAALITLLIILALHKLWVRLCLWPQAAQHKQALKNTQKAMMAMNKGLSAIAAQDLKTLRRQIKKSYKYLPGDQQKTSLLILLEAQEAHMQGDEAGAKKLWQQLSQSKDMSFLGTRQLLKASAGDLSESAANDNAALLENALKQDPKNPWLLDFAYHQALQYKNLTEALHLLEKKYKSKAIEERPYRSEKIALTLAMAQAQSAPKQADKYLKKAYKLDAFFAPTLRIMALQAKPASGIKDKIKRAWTYAPHPELIEGWMALLPEKNKDRPMAKIKWIEKLVTSNPSRPLGALAIAHIAFQENLWGQTRRYLDLAQKLTPPEDTSPALCELYARLERAQHRNENAAQSWLAKARECKPDETWQCALTGMTYKNWQAFIPPHNSFNSLIWQRPGDKTSDAIAPLTLSANSLSSSEPLPGL